MRRIICLFTLLVLIVGLSACEQDGPQTKDPLESLTYQYLNHVKVKNWDAAYAMLSDETRKYYPKEQFIEYAESFILPKVDAVYVTRIEKHKLDASIQTAFKPKSSWATYNTLEAQKIKLDVVYQDGNWLITFPDIIAKAKELEEKDAARKARVEKWSPKLKFEKFTVENKITDEGPMLVFDGIVQNTAEEACEMVMIMVDFLGPNGEKVFNIVVVPIYVSPREEKDGLKPGEKEEFQSTISSEIPDNWVGKIDYRVYDAGPMPQKQ